MYRVRIHGLYFDIEDGHTALSFADLARAKFVPTDYITEPDVTIQFPYENETKEEQEDE